MPSEEWSQPKLTENRWLDPAPPYYETPGFVDPDGPDDDPDTWADNDYHPAANTVCIDAGDDTAEIDSEMRVWDDGNADIGVDETGACRFGDMSCSGAVDPLTLTHSVWQCPVKLRTNSNTQTAATGSRT